MTPGKKAYFIAVQKLAKAHAKYNEGRADDDEFSTPAKQKKVAKQLAKFHNRLLKKLPELKIEELDED